MKSPLGQALQSETDDTIIDMEAGIERWIGVGNKVDSDDASQATKNYASNTTSRSTSSSPQPPTSSPPAAGRRGEPLDRSTAPDVWDAVEKLVDSLALEAASVA